MLVCFAFDDAYVLGVLSSSLHVVWALALGGRLGVGNDPRYNKTRCFDPFPLPTPDDTIKKSIRRLGEQLDAHRKRQQSLHPELTITGMYNVLEKLRSGEALTAKEKKIHEEGLVSVLKQIHDELDAAVFDAYGWPHDLTDEQILERLVALNAERAEEEKRGVIRWLRPEFQNPDNLQQPVQTALDISPLPGTAADGAGVAIRGEGSGVRGKAKPDKVPWPKELPAQIALLRDTVAAEAGAFDAATIAKRFSRARVKDLETVLDSLAALGTLVSFESTAGKLWRRS